MKKHSQKGFGAVEIIVAILVLCLIGGAVWFVLSSKKDSKDSSSDNQGTSQTARSDNDMDETNETNADYLVVKEWGIKIPLSDELKGLSYKMKNEGGEYAAFTFDDLRGSTECGGDLAVGTISRYTGDEQHPVTGEKIGSMGTAYVAKVGQYYYMPSLPQAACSDDETIQNRISESRNPFNDAVLKAEQL